MDNPEIARSVNADRLMRAAREPFVVTLREEEYDVANVAALAQELEGAQEAINVIIDMTRVKYLDSVALGTLVVMRRTRQGAGGATERLVITSQTLEHIFVVTGLNQAFRICSSLEVAINEAGGSA
jgi:anti-anti-sigma factor